jgi:hypothetical protein
MPLPTAYFFLEYLPHNGQLVQPSIDPLPDVVIDKLKDADTNESSVLLILSLPKESAFRFRGIFSPEKGGTVIPELMQTSFRVLR